MELQLNFDPFPVIETERLVLRNVTAADVNEIYFLRSDENVMRYIDRPKANSPEEALAFIQLITQNMQEQNGVTWGVCIKGTNTIIGYLGYWQLQKENFRSEFGYALHPDHHGKGIMSEAVKAVIRYGFDSIGFHSLEANINPANDASRKLLLRNGFVKEAYFRENYFYNGVFLDSEIYSLLATDQQD